jgi:hypothetical protein
MIPTMRRQDKAMRYVAGSVFSRRVCIRLLARSLPFLTRWEGGREGNTSLNCTCLRK